MQAQFELGEFYYDGKRVERDLSQALHWFEQASLQGHAQSQYHLGMMFFRGEGVPANAVQAYIVLKMAAVNGSDEAMDSADVIAAQMPAPNWKSPARYSGRFSATTCWSCRTPTP